MAKRKSPKTSSISGSKQYDLSKIENKILHGDCMKLLPRIPSNSVDLILADLPYGTTRNKWDSILPLQDLWDEYRRIAKEDAAIILTAAQPFTSTLVMSNLNDFKIEWIWQKTIGSGQLNIKHQPLRMHESVLVFYSNLPTYNPQMTEGEPYSFTRKATYEGPGYNKQKDVEVDNTGFRHPKTVLCFPNPRIKNGHPTQKPVPLFEYFINTYSNPGDLVLDNAIGAGTTAVAALRTGRRFVGMEIDKEYVEMSRRNIKAAAKELKRGSK
jgi:DNA modification methylase